MSKMQEAISLGLILGIHMDCLNLQRQSLWSQSSMRINDIGHTETTSKVTETINSIDYNTGWQYSVTGTNVGNGSQALNPSSVRVQ